MILLVLLKETRLRCLVANFTVQELKATKALVWKFTITGSILKLIFLSLINLAIELEELTNYYLKNSASQFKYKRNGPKSRNLQTLPKQAFLISGILAEIHWRVLALKIPITIKRNQNETFLTDFKAHHQIKSSKNTTMLSLHEKFLIINL